MFLTVYVSVVDSPQSLDRWLSIQRDQLTRELKMTLHGVWGPWDEDYREASVWMKDGWARTPQPQSGFPSAQCPHSSCHSSHTWVTLESCRGKEQMQRLWSQANQGTHCGSITCQHMCLGELHAFWTSYMSQRGSLSWSLYSMTTRMNRSHDIESQ